MLLTTLRAVYNPQCAGDPWSAFEAITSSSFASHHCVRNESPLHFFTGSSWSTSPWGAWRYLYLRHVRLRQSIDSPSTSAGANAQQSHGSTGSANEQIQYFLQWQFWVSSNALHFRSASIRKHLKGWTSACWSIKSQLYRPCSVMLMKERLPSFKLNSSFTTLERAEGWCYLLLHTRWRITLCNRYSVHWRQ